MKAVRVALVAFAVSLLPLLAHAATCWTTPITWSFQQVPTSANFNSFLRDDLNCLKTSIKDDGTLNPNFQRARVYNSGAISINNATPTAVTFDSERFDVGGMHSTVSNTARLTFPLAADCLVGGNVDFLNNNGGNSRRLDILLNGTTTIAQVWVAARSSTNDTILQVSTFYRFAANDYVQLIAYQDSTAAMNIGAAGNYSPEFWATCVNLN